MDVTMTKEEIEQERADAADTVIVEVLKPFTALKACYNPADGKRPADLARFRRKDAEYQAKKGLSRIVIDPKKTPPPDPKGKRAV